MVSHSQIYELKAVHIAEKFRLKDLKNKFARFIIEFSNYEMVVRYCENSYVYLYNYGVVVFFNVDSALQEKVFNLLQESGILAEPMRISDSFHFEVDEKITTHRVYFDRVVVPHFTEKIAEIVGMMLAESTALDYYEAIVEDLLIKINRLSKILKDKGKMLRTTEDLIQFIGLCLDMKQEIISSLYIVDSPDEIWEDMELNKLHRDLKSMFEIGTRYRGLEYKIKIIQESINVIVDLSKSKRETILEVTIILLIAFELIISIFNSIFK